MLDGVEMAVGAADAVTAAVAAGVDWPRGEGKARPSKLRACAPGDRPVAGLSLLALARVALMMGTVGVALVGGLLAGGEGGVAAESAGIGAAGL